MFMDPLDEMRRCLHKLVILYGPQTENEIVRLAWQTSLSVAGACAWHAAFGDLVLAGSIIADGACPIESAPMYRISQAYAPGTLAALEARA